MKSTHKKILGFLGILTVIAVTVFAAFLPTPKTQAVSSVTDTITVKVVTDDPAVKIDNLPNGEIITEPEQFFTVRYFNVDTVKVTLTHTDLSRNVTTYDLDLIEADYVDGEEDYIVRFLKEGE